jgi:CBS domain-containing protein
MLVLGGHEMQARDVMLVNVPAVDTTASLREVAEVLAAEGGDVVLVVDEGRLAGVISQSVLRGILDSLGEEDVLPAEPLTLVDA